MFDFLGYTFPARGVRPSLLHAAAIQMPHGRVRGASGLYRPQTTRSMSAARPILSRCWTRFRCQSADRTRDAPLQQLCEPAGDGGKIEGVGSWSNELDNC
jgi:hypothetical protein